MRQLDPKSVWLFFIQGLVGFGFLFIFLGILVVPFLSIFVALFNKTVEEVLLLGVNPYPASVFLAGSIYLVFMTALAYGWAKLSYKYYRYELTEDGFRKEHGVIWKRYVTIPYDRIQNVDILRGVWARILGLSELQIQTAGMSGVAMSEGRLPGLSQQDAEAIRDELIRRAKRPTSQGL